MFTDHSLQSLHTFAHMNSLIHHKQFLHFKRDSLQCKNKNKEKKLCYLLHGQLNRGFAVGELSLNAGALHLSHHILKPLRFFQHLPVASTKLSKNPIGYMRDGLCWIPQSSPKGLNTKQKPCCLNLRIFLSVFFYFFFAGFKFEGDGLYLHELSPDRLDVVVKEVWLQVVHTELECAQALANKCLRAIES